MPAWLLFPPPLTNAGFYQIVWSSPVWGVKSGSPCGFSLAVSLRASCVFFPVTVLFLSCGHFPPRLPDWLMRGVHPSLSEWGGQWDIGTPSQPSPHSRLAPDLLPCVSPSVWAQCTPLWSGDKHSTSSEDCGGDFFYAWRHWEQCQAQWVLWKC